MVVRKRTAVAAGALALTLGAGLTLGAAAWGSEGAALAGDVRPGKAWSPSVGGEVLGNVECRARSHRAAVQQVIGAYEAARERGKRPAVPESGEESPEVASDNGEGALEDKGASAQGSGGSSGARADSQKEKEPDRASRGSSSPKGRAEGRSDGRHVEAASGNAGAKRPQGPASGGAVAEGTPDDGHGGGAPEPSAVPEGRNPDAAGAPGGPDDSGDGALEPGTLVVGGTAIPYRDVRGGTTPSSGGGLWLGSDAVDDGSWGYFVGHNPGSFAPVRSLAPGASVTVCDRSGAQRSYTVKEVFRVEETATWKTVAPRVCGYGESVVLQTCAGDGTNIIVVAA